MEEEKKNKKVRTCLNLLRLFVLKYQRIGVQRVWHSIPGPVKSDTETDVSSELCCPGAKIWIPALVTRFGEIPRV